MSTIKLIIDWAKRGLKCVRCLSDRNVKYEYEGKHYCLNCIEKTVKLKAKNE
jgi:hypothetical protein